MLTNVYFRDHFRILSPPPSVTGRSRLRLIAPAGTTPTPAPRG